MGSGAIFPIPEDDVLVAPFEIPNYWPQCYALDVGWKRTAALWFARDNQSGTVYAFSEYYQGQQPPAVHAQGIRARGDWIPGVIDPASRGRSQVDGKKLMSEYRALGLDLQPAKNTVEIGLAMVWQALSSGKLKVFRSCRNWIDEFRIYQRDKNGKVVKVNDHLMDCCVAANTKVCTTEGKIPIKDLIGETGKVVSRAGSVAQFIGARRVFKNVPTVNLVFADGSEVICTEDHPFLTPEGWVPAIAMQGHLCYNGIAQGVLWRNLKSRLFPKPYKNFRVSDTTSWESILPVGLKQAAMICTELFGKQLTGELESVRDLLFTTRMEIERIISPLILRECLSESIAACTIPERGITWERNFRGGIGLRKLSTLPQIGTLLKKEKNGISNTTPSKSDMGKSTNLRNLDVLIALKNSLLRIQELIVSAQIIASQPFVEHLALTMKNAFARYVAEILWLASIQNDELALQSVLVNCCRVSRAGARDVFCLTVPGVSAFAIESGLIVHNTRYGWMSGRDRMIPMPVDKPEYTSDFLGESLPTKWMQAISLEYPFSRKPER